MSRNEQFLICDCVGSPSFEILTNEGTGSNPGSVRFKGKFQEADAQNKNKRIYSYDILERERQIDEYKWNIINELSLFNYFTIEALLSYTLKLKILIKWSNIEEDKGKERFMNIINELQNSISI